MPEETKTSNGLLEPDFLKRLERLAIACKKAQLGMTKGERPSRRKGSSIEFADYRDYVQGDDLRFVDWNIFGRLDSLYLKLFRDQEDLTLHLMIDASKSMSFGNPRKLEFACKMAAALGYIALVGYDRITAEAFMGDTSVRLPNCRGKAAGGKLFAFLEGIEASGITSLEEDCRSYVIRNRSKGVAILFTDFFDPEGYEGCLRRLMQSGSELYVVHVLAPEEIDPEVMGDLKLVDCETQTFSEISMSPALLKRYKKNRDAFCEEIRRFCVSRNIGYFLAPSNAPVEQLTLDVLRKGGLVR
ncbi:DUF58 domain-containing protein [Candidatus Hydrogenedentota bacterium]